MLSNRISSLLLSAVLMIPLTACGLSQSPAPSDPVSPSTSQQTPPADPARDYVRALSLEDQIAQLFFVRCPETEAAALAAQYNPGGYILFGRDIEGQTPESLRQTIRAYQAAVQTPMLIGVDEEGGTVVRISSNPAFRHEKFSSPQELFAQGGIERLVSDTAEKDRLLHDLEINVNLAPVCDVSTDPQDFIYSRTMGLDAAGTADAIAAVVKQMQSDGIGMVLKHFPGYGSNVDTHTGISVDDRALTQFETSDFLPFQAGIAAGAGAILVSHNIMTALDSDMPASLSPAVHRTLRESLEFDGVIMTDDLIMDAITQYTGGADAAVLAVQAGNDLLISSDFETQYAAVLQAVQDGTISSTQITDAATRVIGWKMALGLLPL